MTQWIPEEKEYFVNTRIEYKDGQIFELRDSIEPNGKKFSRLTKSFFEKPVHEVVTRLEEIELWKIDLSNKDRNLEFVVGVRDSEGIEYISEKSDSSFQKFLFDYEHEPRAYRTDSGQIDQWPDKLGNSYTGFYRFFHVKDFETYLGYLKEKKPEISENMDKCIDKLKNHEENFVK